MVDITPQRQARTLASRPPLAEFATVAVALGLALYGIAEAALAVPARAMAAYGVCMLLVLIGLQRGYPHPVFGLCNAVTMGRAALLSLLAGAVFEATSVSPWLVFCVALVTLTLDGLDGWLARRTRLKSDFGARFDMETDAALGAVLALYLLLSGTTGAEILVLGFMRYVFVAAGFVLPALRADLPVSLRRKAICVVQIGALIALIFPTLPAALIAPVSLAASALLVYSFAVDTVWLLRRKG